MDYTSTRDHRLNISGSKAIIQGISKDGGLFVPCRFPSLREKLESLKDLDYPALAAQIMECFLPEFDPQTLRQYAKDAYAGYDSSEVVPLSGLQDNLFMLELWHGPTLAFKDMALQMLPRLMSGSMQIQGVDKKILILVATSGDTGKAALDGFADVDHTAISVFYPQDGVSRAQKLQMTTQRGGNVQVTGIDGNFDDAQSAVKQLFVSPEFNQEVAQRGYALSSANSINWGRLLPQIVYYFWAYLRLVRRARVKMGDRINICVPTGNFGNILAAYYAKQMGLPVNKLICASNKNQVLTDFFETGTYDVHREFFKTNSPSMDILISSNLERLLYHMLGNDDNALKALMQQLKQEGSYTVPGEVKKRLQDEFFVGCCDETQTLRSIKTVYDDQSYLMDTHTAVGHHVARRYQKQSGDTRPTIVASTASPYKFAGSVVGALGWPVSPDEFENVQKIQERTGWKVPEQILELKELPVRFPGTCPKQELRERILEWIGK